MLVLYFALAGCLAFTVLLVQTARSLLRGLTQIDQIGTSSVAVATIFLMSCAAIDTAFVVLLLRAAQTAFNAPAAG